VSGQAPVGSVNGGDVLVRGTGLIGTSVGLSLQAAGWRVWLTDPDARAQRHAAELGAGSLELPAPEVIDLVVVCAPPDRTAGVVIDSLETYRRREPEGANPRSGCRPRRCQPLRGRSPAGRT
jgi:threonine dehydrogenase-like Zn-dependent dehydrogenase